MEHDAEVVAGVDAQKMLAVAADDVLVFTVDGHDFTGVGEKVLQFFHVVHQHAAGRGA